VPNLSAYGRVISKGEGDGVESRRSCQLKGTYPTQAAGGGSLIIAGLEAAGEVAVLGEKVSGFKVGDRVMAMCAGGYAEFTTLDQRLAIPIPSA